MKQIIADAVDQIRQMYSAPQDCRAGPPSAKAPMSTSSTGSSVPSSFGGVRRCRLPVSMHIEEVAAFSSERVVSVPDMAPVRLLTRQSRRGALEKSGAHSCPTRASITNPELLASGVPSAAAQGRLLLTPDFPHKRAVALALVFPCGTDLKTAPHFIPGQ
jgi:hypothetical protein